MKRWKKPVKAAKPERIAGVLPGDLRRQSQRETIAHLLLLGWPVERIARKMHCTGRAVRYAIDKPEFRVLFEQFQHERLQRVERQLGSLLNGACDALDKMLRHPNWQARDAALNHILRVHGRYIDKIDVRGHLDHARHVQAELVDGQMTEEMRTKARELLALQRAMYAKQLPAKFEPLERDPRDHDHNALGRFTSGSGNGHEDED
jgi:hypothetical protein